MGVYKYIWREVNSLVVMSYLGYQVRSMERVLAITLHVTENVEESESGLYGTGGINSKCTLYLPVARS